MRDKWVHIGRLWTNGETFLAVDAALRGGWQGASNDDFDRVIALGQQAAQRHRASELRRHGPNEPVWL